MIISFIDSRVVPKGGGGSPPHTYVHGGRCGAVAAQSAETNPNHCNHMSQKSAFGGAAANSGRGSFFVLSFMTSIYGLRHVQHQRRIIDRIRGTGQRPSRTIRQNIRTTASATHLIQLQMSRPGMHDRFESSSQAVVVHISDIATLETSIIFLRFVCPQVWTPPITSSQDECNTRGNVAHSTLFHTHAQGKGTKS